MLPDETFLVYKAVDQGLFINKHLFFEYTNFSKNQDFYMKQNFSEFNEKIILERWAPGTGSHVLS